MWMCPFYAWKVQFCTKGKTKEGTCDSPETCYLTLCTQKHIFFRAPSSFLSRPFSSVSPVSRPLFLCPSPVCRLSLSPSERLTRPSTVCSSTFLFWTTQVNCSKLSISRPLTSFVSWNLAIQSESSTNDCMKSLYDRCVTTAVMRWLKCSGICGLIVGRGGF